MKPNVSVVLPCYNAAATLGATLDSLIAQTDPRWEAICVDDGSSDHTLDVIRQYVKRDGRIRLATHSGKGPSAARNAGALQQASGTIIAFCDADDLWRPEKLARLDGVFQNPSVDAVFGRVAFYTGKDSAVMRQSTVPKGDLTIRQLLAENPVCTMSNLSIRRARLLEWGGFDETLSHNEDLEWLIRITGQGARIVGDPKLHVYYRTESHGLSANLEAMRAGRAIALQAAQKYGVAPDKQDEAVFLRYLARRALRLGDGRAAFGLTLAGLSEDPRAFLLPLRRGGATAAASVLAPIIPRALRRALFAA